MQNEVVIEKFGFNLQRYRERMELVEDLARYRWKSPEDYMEKEVSIAEEKDKWKVYEKHKSILSLLCSSSEEYDQVIRCLASRLGI